MLRLASIELGVSAIPAKPGSEQATQVMLTCTGSIAEIVVRDSLTSKQLLRRLDVPPGNDDVVARIVAIGAAELVLTSWMELTVGGSARGTLERSSQASPAPALSRAAREAVERRHGHPGGAAGSVLAVGGAVGPFERVGWGWAGGLRAGWAAPLRWSVSRFAASFPVLEVDLIASRNSADGGLGNVNVALWSIGLRTAVRVHLSALFMDAGAGARFGLARLAGEPSDATTVRAGTVAGSWGGPVAYVAAGARAGHFVTIAGVEAGYVLRTVLGLVDGDRALSISGLFIMGSLAVGWSGQ